MQVRKHSEENYLCTYVHAARVCVCVSVHRMHCYMHVCEGSYVVLLIHMTIDYRYILYVCVGMYLNIYIYTYVCV